VDLLCPVLVGPVARGASKAMASASLAVPATPSGPGIRQSRLCGLKQREGAPGVASVVAVGGGDAGMAVQAQEADGQAAQRCHDAGCVSGSDQGLVFLVGDVADPVELVLDLPVAADPGRQGGGIGVTIAGDEVDDLDGLLTLLVTVRRSCATWAAPANSIQAGASTALTVRRALRP
jgi:hypothetical protein